MFRNRVHKVITKLRFKAAEIWFPRGIMNLLWIEKEIINTIHVARYRKINFGVQDLHSLKTYTRNIDDLATLVNMIYLVLRKVLRQ